MKEKAGGNETTNMYTSQNCTKIILREAKFEKIFLGGMPPDPPKFTCFVEAWLKTFLPQAKTPV